MMEDYLYLSPAKGVLGIVLYIAMTLVEAYLKAKKGIS